MCSCHKNLHSLRIIIACSFSFYLEKQIDSIEHFFKTLNNFDFIKAAEKRLASLLLLLLIDYFARYIPLVTRRNIP